MLLGKSMSRLFAALEARAVRWFVLIAVGCHGDVFCRRPGPERLNSCRRNGRRDGGGFGLDLLFIRKCDSGTSFNPFTKNDVRGLSGIAPHDRAPGGILFAASLR